MTGKVIKITSVEEFDQIVNETSKAVIIDFTATWCGPCRMIAPVYAELSEEYESIIFLKVDVDEMQEICEKYEITCMPTFKVLKNKEVVDEFQGADIQRLNTIVKKYGNISQHEDTIVNDDGNKNDDGKKEVEKKIEKELD